MYKKGGIKKVCVQHEVKPINFPAFDWLYDYPLLCLFAFSRFSPFSDTSIESKQLE